MGFEWTQEREPHATRRRNILKAHPEVARLCGHEWKSKYICFLCLIVPQVFLSVATINVSWTSYILVAYFIGATITQALFLAVHELSHDLYFKNPLHNRLFSFVANLPIGIPFATAFRFYHLAHHKSQGVERVDTDIPSDLEARFVNGPVTKLVWITCQIIVYAVRPMFMKALPFSWSLLLNWVVQLSFDAILFRYYGIQPLAYFMLCVFLAGGLHPCAGHFVSEHYMFPELSRTQETYSYYGPLNRLTWNVGFHNEHHDFPFVPWSKLPLLKKAAPEFYDTLQVCESWPGVLYSFVLRADVGPTNRMKRLQM